MLREIDLSEISDGKLYTANDMVRIECQECKGCSSCCHDMGESIILDPYDLYQLEKDYIHRLQNSCRERLSFMW